MGFSPGQPQLCGTLGALSHLLVNLLLWPEPFSCPICPSCILKCWHLLESQIGGPEVSLEFLTSYSPSGFNLSFWISLFKP